ncbi:LpxI family protein [Aristophania vespae]|uniref:LpxI family protein n=1 Tax=Aristophania vespae TaxID=2697033 RepID=UPI0023514F7D|nr:UDP-2,3-diacylglucosamine diphosphatase LpxI [Aristophania vespae]UMM64608.1 UDP-2,3-diacylglucosamine pyrophosphatase LpxI [Aristophania vespae]
MLAHNIGILAGGGPLPAELALKLTQQGYQVFIIGFQGFAEAELIKKYPHQLIRLAAAGEILRALRAHNCKDIILLGPVKRPSWRDLRPDAEGARILARLGKAIFRGDDGLLSSIISILEEEGFRVRGAHEFLNTELSQEGALGLLEPSLSAWEDIKRAAHILTVMAPLDVGQACVVRNGLALAIEALEGTDKMLERCRFLDQENCGGILLKMPKLGQDLRADMPTIGPMTIKNAALAKLDGIAFIAGKTLFSHKESCIKAADEERLFLYGLSDSLIKEC